MHSICIMDKRPSKMQGQFDFSKSGGASNSFGRDLIFNFNFILRLTKVPNRGPTPIYFPLEVHGGCWKSAIEHGTASIHMFWQLKMRTPMVGITSQTWFLITPSTHCKGHFPKRTLPTTRSTPLLPLEVHARPLGATQGVFTHYHCDC